MLIIYSYIYFTRSHFFCTLIELFLSVLIFNNTDVLNRIIANKLLTCFSTALLHKIFTLIESLPNFLVRQISLILIEWLIRRVKVFENCTHCWQLGVYWNLDSLTFLANVSQMFLFQTNWCTRLCLKFNGS